MKLALCMTAGLVLGGVGGGCMHFILPEPYSMAASFFWGMICGFGGVIMGMRWQGMFEI
jgi:hypothetical protein